eukprot:gb/GECG01005220.1/.p1 GENE.gb/GECG01005220.1/~~gb/GECG01005220.1/.p1  ORF type:complete len:237 (+),score=31.31 gb/GECG01005220.1/:1-711(+)
MDCLIESHLLVFLYTAHILLSQVATMLRLLRGGIITRRRIPSSSFMRLFSTSSNGSVTGSFNGASTDPNNATTSSDKSAFYEEEMGLFNEELESLLMGKPPQDIDLGQQQSSQQQQNTSWQDRLLQQQTAIQADTDNPSTHRMTAADDPNIGHASIQQPGGEASQGNPDFSSSSGNRYRAAEEAAAAATSTTTPDCTSKGHPAKGQVFIHYHHHYFHHYHHHYHHSGGREGSNTTS